jgi:3',5'-cyclic-AMP phosphodiesterase
MTTRLVQLSDLHIREPGRLAYGRVDTSAHLMQAVEAIALLPQRPDALVITGDLTDFGRTAEYLQLRRLLAPLAVPTYLMPGNHDERTALRAAFPEHSYLGSDGFVQYSVAIGRLRLLALDTVIVGGSAGELCAKRLRWLAEQLDRHAGEPVIIAMHHPPFRTLIGHMDAIGLLRGADELEALVALHPNVERVICGHLHRPIHVRFGGTIAATIASPAHQVCLDLAPEAQSAWVLEPPGFALHVLPAAGRLVSHAVASGRYAGPYPFHCDARLID